MQDPYVQGALNPRRHAVTIQVQETVAYTGQSRKVERWVGIVIWSVFIAVLILGST